MSEPTWPIFHGDGKLHPIEVMPTPPPWRQFDGIPVTRTLKPATVRAEFQFQPEEIDLINAALYLRRPLLITGKPGIGKSTLVHSVAYELRLGEILVWPINTRTTLPEGLYRYDAIGRLQAQRLDEVAKGTKGQTRGIPAPAIGRYIKLGPLGTAFLPSALPRVLLIDEIDKSDIDLPNDLLNIFEQGTFEIPELSRLPKEEAVVSVDAADGGDPVPITRGRVTVKEFPFIVMTSNGEREFPGPFLRRCIRLEMQPPSEEKLGRIVEKHLGVDAKNDADPLVKEFFAWTQERELATDQLLNAVHLVTRHDVNLDAHNGALKQALFRELK